MSLAISLPKRLLVGRPLSSARMFDTPAATDTATVTGGLLLVAVVPRDVVAVFVPEYVVGHWWEQFLHDQSALRIKARLLFKGGVMVISVLWQFGHEPEASALVAQDVSR